MQNMNRPHEVGSGTSSLKTVDRSVQALYEAVKSHHNLMVSILGQNENSVQCKKCVGRSSRQPGEKVLNDALLEAIEVLEESRKAFKSKRLETLRKKLTKVLIESNR
ncbi:MAG: hypothetical protein GY846_11165 [Deltaproteobacteria bacterium]|nr:hypothetical protein [Deltaproteobacteria bacterium]